MKYVTAKNLIVFALTTLVLSGCKEPDMQLSTLGKKLPAPVLKGAHPFQQDFDAQGFVRLQGVCDNRISTILISFNKSIWHQPPTSPDITGTSLTAGLANDTDCGDGVFDVYMTKNDLQGIWGINTGNNGDKVDYIYIKGASVIGDTETLTLVDSNPDNGGYDGTATTIMLEKTWPRGFAGSNQCGSFHASLTNSKGDRTKHTTDVGFQLSKHVSGVTTRGITAYRSWADCYADANITDNFVIPSGSDFTEVIYRFPNTPLDSVLSFKIINPSTLTAATAETQVTLRSSDYASEHRWLAQESPTTQLQRNVCYPFNLRSYLFDNSIPSDQFGGTLDYTVNDSRLKFYTDANCTSVTTSFTFTSYESLLSGYIKFTEATASDNFAPIEITATAATGTNLIYNSLPFKLRVDLSSKTIATKIDAWGPRELENGVCHSFDIVTMNDNGTVIPVNGLLTVNLATNESSIGTFFAEDSCATVISSVEIPKNTSGKKVYFRPAASAAGTYHLNVSASGMGSRTQEIDIVTPIRNFKIANFNLQSGACRPLSIGVSDRVGIFRTASKNYVTTISVTMTPSPGTDILFLDPNCSTPFTGSLSVKSGTSTTELYVQTTGMAGKSLDVTVYSSGELNGASYQGVLQ